MARAKSNKTKEVIGSMVVSNKEVLEDPTTKVPGRSFASTDDEIRELIALHQAAAAATKEATAAAEADSGKKNEAAPVEPVASTNEKQTVDSPKDTTTDSPKPVMTAVDNEEPKNEEPAKSSVDAAPESGINTVSWDSLRKDSMEDTPANSFKLVVDGKPDDDTIYTYLDEAKDIDMEFADMARQDPEAAYMAAAIQLSNPSVKEGFKEVTFAEEEDFWVYYEALNENSSEYSEIKQLLYRYSDGYIRRLFPYGQPTQYLNDLIWASFQNGCNEDSMREFYDLVTDFDNDDLRNEDAIEFFRFCKGVAKYIEDELKVYRNSPILLGYKDPETPPEEHVPVFYEEVFQTIAVYLVFRSYYADIWSSLDAMPDVNTTASYAEESDVWESSLHAKAKSCPESDPDTEGQGQDVQIELEDYIHKMVQTGAFDGMVPKDVMNQVAMFEKGLQSGFIKESFMVDVLLMGSGDAQLKYASAKEALADLFGEIPNEEDCPFTMEEIASALVEYTVAKQYPNVAKMLQNLMAGKYDDKFCKVPKGVAGGNPRIRFHVEEDEPVATVSGENKTEIPRVQFHVEGNKLVATASKRNGTESQQAEKRLSGVYRPPVDSRKQFIKDQKRRAEGHRNSKQLSKEAMYSGTSSSGYTDTGCGRLVYQIAKEIANRNARRHNIEERAKTTA